MTDPNFLLFFRGLARHAPGTEQATLRALRACDLPDDPVVWDLGAGTGASTLVLAEALDAPIHAVDLLAPSLEALATRAERRGLAGVETHQVDALQLDLEPESVDLMWCEGAIYTMGWRAALEAWTPALKTGGHLVVSDAVWGEAPTARTREFWASEYPGISTADEVVARADAAGFDMVEQFAIGADGWNEYYAPLLQRVTLVLDQSPSEELQKIAREVQREIEVYDRDPGGVDYTFFVMRKG